MTNREEIERRRTFAIISHPDAGKTTLTEKLLLYGGAINQAGSVKGKQSAKHAVSDWMDIEKQRGISVTSSVLQFNYAGKCVNILDTPGHQDFSEDTYRTLMAADSAVMVIDAAKGVEAQTIKLFKVCTLRHIPIFTFINKMDREARDPFELMENIEEILGIKTYPMNWPIGCGKEFKGVFDRNTRKVLAFSSDGRANGVKKVDETEAELGDPALDELLTPYLHQQLVDEIELLDGAAEEFDLDKVLRGELSPVFFGSALTNFGVEPFLENFLRLTPTPLARVDSLTGETVDPCRDEFSAFIFKIQANMNKAHRDRIAFMRICSGKFERGMEAFHVQEGKNIKLATGTQLMAQDRAIVDEAYAGDIVAATKLSANTGDTLTASGDETVFAAEKYPVPCFFKAISAKDKNDEGKISNAIKRMVEEDKTLSYDHNHETHQRILGGLGEQHLDAAISKMKAKFGVDVIVSDPIIAYRESIRKKVQAEGKHKKQSGGHGQYGHVKIEFEPCDSDALVFEEKVFGGSVPKNYFPAVEKGLVESTAHGVLAGYPVVNLKATLLDGSYHPVDSSEQAFKMAAHIAYKQGLAQAQPCLLEPICLVKVILDDASTGDIMTVINKRRGTVLGMNPSEEEQGMTELDAQMPQSEITDLATVVRQITRGLGHFTAQFDHYEQLPQALEADVIANAPKFSEYEG